LILSRMVDASEYGADLPLGVVLLLSKILDSTPLVSGIWRQVIPFGMADPPHGIFSHRVGAFPTFGALKGYNDVEGGILEFLTTEGTELGDVTTRTSMLAILVLVIMIRLVKLLLYPFFRSVGTSWASRVHGHDWEQNNRERIGKFAEYCFRLLYHSMLAAYGLWYFADKEWWDPSRGGTRNLWLGHPNQPIEPGMIWYYLLQAAYNVDALLSLVKLSFEVKFNLSAFPFSSFGWSKNARGDFLEMAIHHILTNALVFGSSYFRFFRIGSMCLLVHDVSDVPVDLSKLANFLKWRKSTICCFFVMVVVWFITRLLILPFVIYRSGIYESNILMFVENMDPEIYYVYYPFFSGLMGMIILLHLAWFKMFVNMFIILVIKGETHDLSEHKKGEKNGSVPTKKRGTRSAKEE